MSPWVELGVSYDAMYLAERMKTQLYEVFTPPVPGSHIQIIYVTDICSGFIAPCLVMDLDISPDVCVTQLIDQLIRGVLV